MPQVFWLKIYDSTIYLAKSYIENFRSFKGVDVFEFIEKAHWELNYNIESHTIQKTKKKAIEFFEEKYIYQYGRLWDNIEELE